MDEIPKVKTQEEYLEEYKKEIEVVMDRIHKIQSETKKLLESDPEIQKYFQQFNTNTVETFIENYARKKGEYLEYGERDIENNERHDLQYYEEAVDGLKMIQIKKLYDLRCQWGANQIKIEGMDISWDFWMWTSDIFNCPFLPSITSDEFDLYCRFADSKDFERYNKDEFLELFNNERSDEDEDYLIPEWFHFHNLHTGAGLYFSLPDFRFEKENFYREISSKKINDEIEKKYESGELVKHVFDDRPDITYYHFEDVEKFIKLFENKKTLNKFYGYEKCSGRLIHNPDSEDTNLHDQAYEIFNAIINLDIVLPIESHDDWREALIQTWKKYEQGQIAVLLPLAYQDYLFRIDNNIRLEAKDLSHEIDCSNNVKRQILDGRELAGEPRDFNY